MISQPPNHKLGGQSGAPQILCRLSQCSVLGPPSFPSQHSLALCSWLGNFLNLSILICKMGIQNGWED